MEQNRERFWNNSEEVNKEMADYLKLSEENYNEDFTIADSFFTLLCC